MGDEVPAASMIRPVMLGEVLGDKVDDEIGYEVGDTLGNVLGIFEGNLVGIKLGVEVGGTTGLGDGSAVGGKMMTLPLSPSSAVVLTVGVVGTRVGCFEGDTVGVGVPGGITFNFASSMADWNEVHGKEMYGHSDPPVASLGHDARYC